MSPRTTAALCRTALSATLAAAPGAWAGDPVESGKYAPLTVVIYNQNLDASRELAAYYAAERSVPLENLIGLAVPEGEVISRADYERTVRGPLRAKFDAQGWWDREEDAGGVMRPVRNTIKFAAVIYGMPLKIEATPGEPTGATDPATGEPVRAKRTLQNTDAASLCSELALLGVDLPDLSGPAPNAYFRAADAYGRPELLLASRIDGPTYEDAKRLVDDAAAIEAGGLWGTAVIDIAKLAESKGPGYGIGDDWLENGALFYHKAGIPALVDRSPAVLPSGYPLRDDVVLYFGWYTGHVTGALKDTAFRFKRGAVACHLHSFSASTLQTDTQFWVGPLLARGACGVLGNVYEPFLTMTTHFDLFNARLLGGFTLAEAAWMATPAASWMTTVVGDPLYQPFRRGVRYDMATEREHKSFRLAVRRWGGDRDALLANLERAATNLESAALREMAALHLLGEKDYPAAVAAFEKAEAAYTEPADKLRQIFHRARAMSESGDEEAAVALLRAAAGERAGTPGGTCAMALANQLDPPPPPPPAQ